MKMHQLLLFILQATLLSIHFPCFYSRNPTATSRSTRFIPPACSDEPFQCGILEYIAYPFWGGSRPESCGRQGFEMVCSDENIPILKISSLSFQVQLIDFDTNTLKIAREDLWNAKCPKVFHNTTIDPDLFGYLANDKNLTLYFNCTNIDQEALQNQFTCDGDDSNTTNVFMIVNASSGSGFGITCSKNIFVPVNSEAAESLKDPPPSSINIFRGALNTGFSIKWQKDEFQHRAPFCNSKIYGSCIGPTSRTLRDLPCSYYKNGCSRPASLEQDQSPGPAPESEDDNNRTANGIPPVHSLRFPFEYGHRPFPQPRLGSYPEYRMAPSDPSKSWPLVWIIRAIVLGTTGIVIVSVIIYRYCKSQRLQRCSNQGSNQEL